MSATRRKEKLQAGLEGLFSKPAAKKTVESADTPPAGESLVSEPAPVESEVAEIDEPVAAVVPVEIEEPAAAPFEPAPVVEFEPDFEPEPVPPAAEEPPLIQKPAMAPASPRPAVTKTNGVGYAGHEFGREEQVVVFTLGEEYYAVDIAAVESIIKMQEITAVPNAPAGVEGVINLRGLVLPVVCLRARLDMPRIPITKETRIVVVEIHDDVVGCIVDSVVEVLRIPENRIEPPSALMSTFDSAFIRGVGKVGDRLIILVDLNKLLVLQ